MIQVTLEGFSSGRGEAKFGFRPASVERFRANDVVGFFESAGVNAQVAVGGLEHGFQLVEGERTVYGQCADDTESHAFVDQAVEIGRDSLLRGVCRSVRSSRYCGVAIALEALVSRCR